VSQAEREVVIVGGGPAGAAAALFLRQQGVDVLLLEAARFPRDKICGEGVSPEAWRLLRAMGAAEDVARLAPRPLRGMRVIAPDGTVFEGVYRRGGETLTGFAVRRTRLDATLLDAARRAGAEVREGARVAEAVRSAGGVTGVRMQDGESIRARFVLGCDGRWGACARAVGGLRGSRFFRRFALRLHLEGVAGLGSVGEMHVGRGGYCGIAPLSDTSANVAFVLDASAFAAAAGRLEDFARETLAQRFPAVAARCRDAKWLGPPRAIGPLAVSVPRRALPGLLLLGDAAGFYDPFTGEGVTLALRSAELAVGPVVDALHGRVSSAAAAARYEREYAGATRDKFRLNRLLQWVVAWPAVANAVARRLRARPRTCDELVGIAGDFVPARRALGPRFLLQLLQPGA
jgi:flavin-dependent dehydrogenase